MGFVLTYEEVCLGFRERLGESVGTELRAPELVVDVDDTDDVLIRC